VKVVRSSREVSAWCDRYRAAGLSIALVPTMGALHAGHVSLLRRARSECDKLVVTIFVNPAQFGPGEDLEGYPSTPGEDLDACRAAGADLVFLGSTPDIYPAGFQTWVSVEELSKPLCGRSRPGHFRGVATVVTQLFHLVRPHRAYFGKKDFQQLRVIQRLAADLHMGIDVVGCETVRDEDGLALSSRNAYLAAEARKAAPSLHRGLLDARDWILQGEARVEEIRERVLAGLARVPGIQVEYFEVLDAEHLREFPGGVLDRRPGGVLLAVAARVGKARLIDNLVLSPEE
jgi:pantoate--beta-alanine ligase